MSMDKNADEFNEIADSYSDIRKNVLGKYSDTAFIYKTQLLKHILLNEPKSILDFGCGIGLNIPYLHDLFENTKLFGCDVSPKSIEIAKKNYPYCDFNVTKNTTDLQIYKNIDCVFISTVLHHIPQTEHEYWIKSLYDILSKEGCIVIFEHNMKNFFTKSIITKPNVDVGATMLSSEYCKRLLLNNFYNTKIRGKEILLRKDKVKLRYTYFFPWRNKLFTFIEHCLFWLPFGAQYCVYARK
jgi:trans-aconitate methyltransferase